MKWSPEDRFISQRKGSCGGRPVLLWAEPGRDGLWRARHRSLRSRLSEAESRIDGSQAGSGQGRSHQIATTRLGS